MNRLLPSLCLVVCLACGSPGQRSDSGVDVAAPTFQERIGLPRCLQVSELIWTGGEPKGDAGFDSLVQLGIRTVVCVDGKAPDLARAKARGLEYVHIPLGYSGISNKAQLSLEGLVMNRSGPFYVHCHHGQHRGPAAASLVALSLGFSMNAALQVLQTAGTSLEYPGLWRDVAAWVPAPADVVFPKLVGVAEVTGFAQGMARADRIFDRVKATHRANWGVPKDHPDLVPEREIDQLATVLFQAFRRADSEHIQDPVFVQAALESVVRAHDLRDFARAGNLAEAEGAFQRVQQACHACHAKFRDE